LPEPNVPLTLPAPQRSDLNHKETLTMPEITSASRGRFAWHELMTTDPDAAQRFYKEVVGWGANKWDGGPMEYTMWTAGEMPIGGLMSLPPDAAAMGAPPSWLAYIQVPDADRTIDEAIKLGATVVVPAQSVDQVGRFGVLRDPQGAVFAVIASANPMPDESDPQPMEFSWHELATDNPAPAVDFYGTLFGWETRGDFEMGEMGTYRMFGRDRFTYGGMMNKPSTMQGPPAWLHYVRVDSADAAAERAAKAGGQTLVPPMEVPGGDRIDVLMDPQGAMFAVHSKA
jgi:uncharacterized protein